MWRTSSGGPRTRCGSGRNASAHGPRGLPRRSGGTPWAFGRMTMTEWPDVLMGAGLMGGLAWILWRNVRALRQKERGPDQPPLTRRTSRRMRVLPITSRPCGPGRMPSRVTCRSSPAGKPNAISKALVALTARRADRRCAPGTSWQGSSCARLPFPRRRTSVGRGPVLAGPEWKNRQCGRLVTLLVVTARLRSGQHGVCCIIC